MQLYHVRCLENCIKKIFGKRSAILGNQLRNGFLFNLTTMDYTDECKPAERTTRY